MKHKLVATDIDGTITDEQGRIHLEAVRRIRWLTERGVRVVLVSGRPLPFVESLALFVGTKAPVIAENGAVARIGEELVRYGEAEPAREALQILETEFKFEYDGDNFYRMVDVSLRKTVNVGAVQEEIKKRNLPVALLETNVMLHLVDERVSKGRTVLDILSRLGIRPEETVVCGDSYNDLPLFEIGALNTTPVNGAESLKERAELVGSGYGGEGFAEIMERVFGK